MKRTGTVREMADSADHTAIPDIDEELKALIFKAQKSEITEHYVYEKLLRSTESPGTKEILEKISKTEFEHYQFWKNYTLRDTKPKTVDVWKYYVLSRLLGLTFALKLMERGEQRAQSAYEVISRSIPAAKSIIEDEDQHEKELIGLIDEERLRYVGSMVLGLNDALVELTGVLAGLSFALQNTRLIAMAGSITGFAASLSMASSEYLSTKSEITTRDPIKAAVYTGLAYIVTVVLLILPFLVLEDLYVALGWSILNAIVVIFGFTYYVSVAKDVPFKKRFSEMVFVSLGIAVLSFFVGSIIRTLLGDCSFPR